jgi:hypothetical protein
MAADPLDVGRQLQAFLARCELAEVQPPPADTADAESWTRVLTAMVTAVAGDHLVLLPRVRVSAPAAEDALAGTARDAVADWLRDLAPVRPGVAALTDALAAGEIPGGAGPGDFGVAQTPAQAPGATWVATAPAMQDPKNPICSTSVLHRDGAAVTDGSVAGFVADSFSEAIPSPGDPATGPQEMTAAAFHHDRPGAQAPQMLLLAVPPDPERGWCLEDVHGVVEDTLWLARVRAADLDDLPELRRLFPLPAPD